MTVHLVAVGSGANIYSLQPKVIQVQGSGRTTRAYNHDVTLQRTKPLNKFSIEAFNEQKLSLEDAASVALTPFDQVLIRDNDFTSTLKMELVYSSIPEGDPTFTGLSAGLSYGISLSLLWAKHAGMFDYRSKRNIPVYATGELPQGGGSVLAIEHLQNKLKAVCDYVESLPVSEHQSMPDSQDEDQPAFYFFYPKNNKGANAEDDAPTRTSWRSLKERARILNGKLIPVTSLRDVLLELLGENGLKEGLHSNRSFPGIEPILWEDQQLFKGRSGLLTDLEVTARSAYALKKIMTVEGKSGSGKSSAVLGGMAKRLVGSKHEATFQPPQRITPASFDSLQDLLKGLLSDITNDDDLLDQWAQIEQPDQLVGQIQGYLKEQYQKTDADTQSGIKNSQTIPYFWVIDQAEELFTHSLYAHSVIGQLHRYLETFATRLDVLIISINRQEYSSDIPWLIDGSDVNAQVSAPSSEELRVLINEQMDTRRLNLELTTSVQTKQLEQRILEDAQGLPLTAIGALLQEMHQRKVDTDPAGKVLKHEYYDDAGGAKGAMAQLAEKALDEADSHFKKANPDTDDKQISQLHHCLFELFVGMDEDGHPITLAPAKSQINDYTNANELWRYINTLRAKGLIVEHGRGSVARYKFAHDTLINGIQNHRNEDTDNNKPHWQTLSQWWNKNTEYLKWLFNIQGLLNSWIESRQAEESEAISYLNDSQLEPATRYQAKQMIHLQNLQAFIESSRQTQLEKAQEAQRQLERIEGLTQNIQETLSFFNFELREVLHYVPSEKRAPVQELIKQLTESLGQFGLKDTKENRLRATALLQSADEILQTDLQDVTKAFPLLQQAHKLFMENLEVEPNNLDFQQDLSMSHERLADFYMRYGDIDKALAEYQAGMDICQTQFSIDPKNLQFQPNLSVFHHKLSDLYLRSGDIDKAKAGYQAGMEIVQALVDRDPNNLKFQQNLSVFHHKLADLYLRSGDSDKAQAGYQTAIEVCQALVNLDPKNLQFQQNLAASHGRLADLYWLNDDIDQALARYQAQMEIAQIMVNKDPNNFEFQKILSVSHHKLADLHLRNGDIEKTLSGYQAAMEISQTQVNKDPNNLEFQRNLSTFHYKLADLYLRNGDIEKTLSGYQAAMEIGQTLVNKDPNNLDFQQNLSLFHTNLADLYLRNGDIDQAQAGYQAGMEIVQTLVNKDPNNLDFQKNLSMFHTNLADLYLRNGDIDQALAGYQVGMKIWQALVDKDPNNLLYQQGLSLFHTNLADLYLRNGDSDQALAEGQAAMEIGQTLVNKDPNNLQHQRDLSVSHNSLADLYLRNGDIDQALAGYQVAMEIRQTLVNKDPNNLDFQRDLSVSHERLADLYLRNGDINQALAGYQVAMEIRQTLVNKDPNNLDFQRDLSVSHEKLAGLYLRNGDIDQALAGYQAGMEIWETLVDKDPNNLDFQRGLSVSHNQLADLYLRNGDSDQALAGYQASMEIRQALVNKDPNNLEYQRDLSVSYEKLAGLYLRNGDIDQALAGYQAGMEIWEALVNKDPNNLDFQRGLIVSLYKLGQVSEANKNSQQASHYWTEALEKTQKLLEKEPSNPDYQNIFEVLSNSLAELEG